eukprot:CAMPEP_0177467686 /NCGR_PEP_ID=MMETSP0369-20130122/18651_1 /TAXON_ID=447022 ORGANISM="Scrippsiella hangoei-like, Strain SHHI-4" /NCGR_SAMPLE_ID=MMETSP0369 /ASSEMBLY_ACC=CAM_ASM_000364 /LENGTH=410 /DNA_ID=CAMNT_0018941797 /DNA_START=27 /DNA_END=1257 /DNA_ORIENTATION=+
MAEAAEEEAMVEVEEEEGDWTDLFAEVDGGAVASEGAAEARTGEDELAGVADPFDAEGDGNAQEGTTVDSGEAAGGGGAAGGGADDDAWLKEEGVYKGIVYKVGGTTGNMLILCAKISTYYGQDAVILNWEFPDVKLKDRLSFDVVPRAGQRPQATNVKVTGHCADFDDGKGKGKGKEKGKGKDKGGGKGGGKGKGKSDIYYAGIVKATTAETPKGQVILDCPRVNELFGADAWFPVGEWPEGLLKGGVVVFTVRENGEVGTAPRAMHVARLQVSPVLVRKELAEEAAAVAAAAAAAPRRRGGGGNWRQRGESAAAAVPAAVAGAELRKRKSSGSDASDVPRKLARARPPALRATSAWTTWPRAFSSSLSAKDLQVLSSAGDSAQPWARRALGSRRLDAGSSSSNSSSSS